VPPLEPFNSERLRVGVALQTKSIPFVLLRFQINSSVCVGFIKRISGQWCRNFKVYELMQNNHFYKAWKRHHLHFIIAYSDIAVVSRTVTVTSPGRTRKQQKSVPFYMLTYILCAYAYIDMWFKVITVIPRLRSSVMLCRGVWYIYIYIYVCFGGIYPPVGTASHLRAPQS
jgi:hypothetical protein